MLLLKLPADLAELAREVLARLFPSRPPAYNLDPLRPELPRPVLQLLRVHTHAPISLGFLRIPPGAKNSRRKPSPDG